MSVYTDVIARQGDTRKSKPWFRDNVRALLEPLDGMPAFGDVVFYSYQAEYADKLKFWDKYPMTLITDVDVSQNIFEGGNLHYLRPTNRVAVGKSIKAGAISYPRRCHHKYLISNASGFYKVPREELEDIGKLPLEQFVSTVMGRSIDIPSSFVWSRL